MRTEQQHVQRPARRRDRPSVDRPRGMLGGGGGSAAPSRGLHGSGTVKIAINPWVGAEANVAVVK